MAPKGTSGTEEGQPSSTTNLPPKNTRYLILNVRKPGEQIEVQQILQKQCREDWVKKVERKACRPHRNSAQANS